MNKRSRKFNMLRVVWHSFQLSRLFKSCSWRNPTPSTDSFFRRSTSLRRIYCGFKVWFTIASMGSDWMEGIGLGMSYLSDQRDVVIRWFRFIWFGRWHGICVFKELCISSSKIKTINSILQVYRFKSEVQVSVSSDLHAWLVSWLAGLIGT
jgi:hypothetical protein